MEPVTVGEVLAPALVLALLVPVALRVLGAMGGVADVGLALGAALLGVVATDLTSGIVHFVCDTFFAEDTPVVGRALIEPFRRHHVDPGEIVRTSILRVNRANCLAMAAVLVAVALWRSATTPTSSSLFGDAWLLGYSLAVALTNQIHRWAHAPVVPRPVRWLQVSRVLLHPARHARHHSTGDHAFCITTGWLNPLFDGIVRVLHHPG
jgi:plasmanylethanolamine desaturase